LTVKQLYRVALLLSIGTIVGSLLEAGFSLYFGYTDDTLTLFGFGLDSLIEVVSGIGIAHMVIRIRINDHVTRDDFEKLALRITGTSFYILAIGLIPTAIVAAIQNHAPETTLSGIIISLLSMAMMVGLMIGKMRVGRNLNSDAIIADANCTKVCIYMSLTLLAASALYYVTKVGYIDAAGTLVIAYLSFREGKECFESAASEKYCGCGDDVPVET
jgi:hypothetical protein